jgi:hypothetical protein
LMLVANSGFCFDWLVKSSFDLFNDPFFFHSNPLPRSNKIEGTEHNSTSDWSATKM